MKEVFIKILSLLGILTPEEKNTLIWSIKDNTCREQIESVANDISDMHHSCPFCGSKHIVKWGRKDGLQRYKCKNISCARTFNSLTGTVLAHLHKKDKWLVMSKALGNDLSVRKTAKLCNISVPTAFSWRHRFLKGISRPESQQLNEVIELDEMYFRRSYKGSMPPNRTPKKRGESIDGGTTDEKVGVLIALDRQNDVVGVVLPDHRSVSITRALEGKIAGNSVLCLDGGSAVIGYAIKSGLEYKVTEPGKYTFSPDPHYHIQTVNSYHSRLRLWIQKFHGVSTKYLHNYIGWHRCHETNLKEALPMGWLARCLA